MVGKCFQNFVCDNCQIIVLYGEGITDRFENSNLSVSGDIPLKIEYPNPSYSHIKKDFIYLPQKEMADNSASESLNNPYLAPHILSKLNNRDLLSLCRIDQRMVQLCSQDTFWTSMVAAKFGDAKVPGGMSWRDFYLELNTPPVNIFLVSLQQLNLVEPAKEDYECYGVDTIIEINRLSSVADLTTLLTQYVLSSDVSSVINRGDVVWIEEMHGMEADDEFTDGNDGRFFWDGEKVLPPTPVQFRTEGYLYCPPREFLIPTEFAPTFFEGANNGTSNYMWFDLPKFKQQIRNTLRNNQATIQYRGKTYQVMVPTENEYSGEPCDALSFDAPILVRVSRDVIEILYHHNH